MYEIKRRLLSDPQYKEGYDRKDEQELALRVGSRVRKLRIFKKISQEDLAKAMRTRQPNIARIEAGKKLPSLSTLHKVAVAMNTHLIEPDFACLSNDLQARVALLEEKIIMLETSSTCAGITKHKTMETMTRHPRARTSAETFNLTFATYDYKK